MVSSKQISQKKIDLVDNVVKSLDEFHKFIIFGADCVGSTQMKLIRKEIGGRAKIVMGKNTLFRKSFTKQFQRYPALQKVISQITGNVGLIFTNEESLPDIRKILEKQSEKLSAKVGQIAQCDVTVPKGVTTISPEKTSFFQSLSISTMINKGAIEILNDVHLITKGSKVGESEVTLLKMLDIKPFSYSLISKIVYDDGYVYSPEVLDITKDDFIDAFNSGIQDVSSVALAIGHTTKCSVSYSIMDAFKAIMGICLDVDHENERTKSLKAAMECAASTVVAAPIQEEQVKAEEPKKAEEEEESDGDIGFGLFD